MNRFQTALTIALTIALSLTAASRGEDPPAQPMIYAGDGLTVVILKMSEDTGEMSGEIRRDKAVYPFSAKMDDKDDEVVRGNFYVDGKPFAFSAREDANSEAMIFVTGAKRYKLLPVVPQQPAQPGQQPQAPQPGNPLNQPAQPPVTPPVQPPIQPPAPTVENPLTGLPGMNDNPVPPAQPPVAPNPATNPPAPSDNPLLNLPGNGNQNPAPANPPPPQPAPPAASAQPAAADNKPVKVKLVKFHDVSMDGVVSHTMLIPEGWTAEGFIEWTGEPDYTPENKIIVKGPDGAKIYLSPSLPFLYTVMNNIPGMPQIPPAGTPPPQDLGVWLAQYLQERNPKIANVKLISDVRNAKFEAMIQQMDKDAGGNLKDLRQTVHAITITYDFEGMKIKQEINVTYVLFPPMINQNLRSDMWMLQFMPSYAAKEDKFDQVKPKLEAIQSTMQPVAKWWVQMFKLRSEIMRVRAEQRMDEIRRRGKMYDQMSDAEFAKYKESMKGSDQGQKDRVDTIYERQEYADTDGSVVTLPIHYNHIFSDGNGNYVMSNNSFDKPGELWTEIKPK